MLYLFIFSKITLTLANVSSNESMTKNAHRMRKNSHLLTDFILLIALLQRDYAGEGIYTVNFEMLF